MHSLLSTLTISVFIYLGAVLNASAEEQLSAKYLCIASSSGGVIYKGGTWQGIVYKPGIKYIVSTNTGTVESVKEFGRQDNLNSLTSCSRIAKTTSFICRDNFDVFRFQLSTRRFVMAKTSGYTSEYEESGLNLSPTTFTPNISVGDCEQI